MSLFALIFSPLSVFARVSSLRLVCTSCFALGQFLCLSSVCMAALRCESVYMKWHLHVTCLFFVHPLFPGAVLGILLDIRCGCLRGYTLRVYSCAPGILQLLYVAGVLAGIRCGHPRGCIRCWHLRACSAVLGRRRLLQLLVVCSRPGVSTCSEVVRFSSSARSLLVCVVGILLARAVFC